MKSMVYFTVYSDATVSPAKVIATNRTLLTMKKWEYVKESGTATGFPYNDCEEK